MNEEMDHELLDHELHRTPCTRTMKLQVRAASRRLGVSDAGWVRMAIQERLDREQEK